MTEAVKVVWETGTEQSELSPGQRGACTRKAGGCPAGLCWRAPGSMGGRSDRKGRGAGRTRVGGAPLRLWAQKRNRKGQTIHQDFRSKTTGTWCLRKEGRDRRESAKTWAAEN